MDIKKQPAKSTDWLYLLFWAIIPLIYIRTIIDYSLTPRQLFTGLFVVLAVLFSWKTLFKNSSLGAPVLLYAGFIGVMLIASSGAVNPVESYAVLSRYGLMLAYLMLTISLLQNRMLSLQYLVKGVVIFAGLASVFTLVEVFKAIGSGDFLMNIYAVSATFSHKNLLSSVLLLSIPFAWMGSAILTQKWKGASLFLLFLLITEIFILRTRGVWISFFIASLVTGVVYFSLGKKFRNSLPLNRKRISLGAGIAVLLLVAFFSASGTKSSLSDSSNLSKRMVFWEHSLEMVKEHPLLGVGPGNWKIYFPKYGLLGTDISVKQGITHIQRPHNDYLWVLAEGGPLSLLFYLGVFAVAFIRLRKNLKQEGVTREDKVIDLALLFGLIAYMVFSLTDFPMERMSHNLLLFTLLALVYRNPLSKRKLSGLAVAKAVVLVLALFSIVVSGYRWQGEKNALLVLQGNASRNAQVMINTVPKAINPFFNMDNFANPLRYYSSIGYLVTEDNDNSWLDAQVAYDLHPNNIIVLNQMGNVLKKRRELDMALKYYKRATDISPSFETARLNKAEILLNKRQYADAMAELIWINIESENRKFVQLLALVLPKFLEESQRNGRFTDIANGIRAQQPQTPPEYINAYRVTRRNLKRNS